MRENKKTTSYEYSFVRCEPVIEHKKAFLQEILDGMLFLYKYRYRLIQCMQCDIWYFF